MKNIICIILDCGLFLFSVWFLIHCITTQDIRLTNAVISVLGTLFITIKAIYNTIQEKKGKREE